MSLTTSAVSSSDATYLKTQTDSSYSNVDIDTETFLTLLVAQLQYQDPLEPSTDTDFLAQLAQITSLEYMQEMSSSVTSSQAYNMVGQYIYAEVFNSETGETDSYLGLVDSVILQNGNTYAVVGSTAIPTDSVVQVYDAAAFDTGDMASYSVMLGKTISASYTGSDGETVTANGTVTSIYQGDDGLVYLTVTGTDGTTQDVAGIYVLSVSGASETEAAQETETDASDEDMTQETDTVTDTTDGE